MSALNAAVESRADFVGFVFYEPSPRNLPVDQASALTKAVPTGVRSVGLFVDPDDDLLQNVLSSAHLDMIQLHGDESRGRVAEIKDRFKLPVIKAIKIRDKDDLKQVAQFRPVADWLLFDSKPISHPLPGGTGHSFDWDVLNGYEDDTGRWFLAGGLTPENVESAVTQVKPPAIDVSSGVENQPGVKDNNKIKRFIENAR